MPPGKRGSAKKKKKKSKKSLSSDATRPPPGESDGDEYSSSKSQQSSPHPVVKAEKREHNSQSLTIDRTNGAAKETQNEIEIDRGLNSRKSNDTVENNSSRNQSLTIDTTNEAAKETQSQIEINRGSRSEKSHEKSSSSRSNSSNGKSRVDRKRAVVNLPALVADLVQPAKVTQSEIEIHRGSHLHNSLDKNSSSRSSSSNDKSRVDKKKVVVIQPAAVADLVQPAKVTQSEIEIDRGSRLLNSLEKSSRSRSSSSNEKSPVDKKKVMVIERAAVADLAQPLESLPENGTCILGDLAVTSSSMVDLANPVSSLVELASQVFDNTTLQEKNDLVVVGTPLEQNNCPTTSEVVGSVPKEHEVEKLVSLDGKSNDCVPDSMNDACHFCGRNTRDRGNEPETSDCSEKQPLIGLAPRPAERTTWKSCCGIFELCSGSSR